MKKIKLLLFMLLTMALTIVPATFNTAAAAGEMTYSLTLSSSTTNIRVGDEITVRLTLDRTDENAPYLLYSMQDEIMYNSEYLKLVDGSISAVSPGFITATRAMSDNIHNKVIMSFVDLSGAGSQKDSSLTVGTFKLKAVKAGTTTIENTDYKVNKSTGLDTYDSTANSLNISISGGGGGGNGGGDVSKDVSAPPREEILADDIKAFAQQGLKAFVTTMKDQLIISGEALNEAAESDMNLAINTADGQLTLTIPPGAIAAGSAVQITMKRLAGAQENALTTGLSGQLRIVTPIYEITLTGEGGAPLEFLQELYLTFGYTESAAVNEGSLAVYRYNEATGQWEKLACEVDQLNNTVSCAVNHFSKYAVMEELSPTAKFSDLPSGHWAVEAIGFMADKGFLQGYPDGAFRPEAPITRAEFTALMVRVLGLTEESEDIYEDVRTAQWHYRAVATAYRHGLVSGYGAGRFGPDDPITREQAAAMLIRALNLQEEADNSGALDSFKDAGDISSWARQAVARAVALKLIHGYPDQNFRPADSTTRAECAALLMRFYQTGLPANH